MDLSSYLGYTPFSLSIHSYRTGSEGANGRAAVYIQLWRNGKRWRESLYLCITIRDTALCWQMSTHIARYPESASNIGGF